jgi:hypothetical protein
MAVLKGDYVLVEGKVGKVTMLDFNPQYHLIDLLDGSMPMAILRSERDITKIDPDLYPLLNSTKENNDD